MYHFEYAGTVPDVFLYEVFDQLEDCGRFRDVFYDGELDETHHAFLDFVKHTHGIHAWVLMNDDTMVGMAWLSDVNRHKTAKIHFFFLPSEPPITITRIARAFVSYAIRLRDGDEYMLDCIHGVTPSFNAKAVRFIQKVGFKIIGELPSCVWSAKSGRMESAKISFCTRDTAPVEWLKNT